MKTPPVQRSHRYHFSGCSGAFDYLDAPPQMVAPPHTPIPFSPALEDFYLPSSEKVVDAIRATLD